MHRKKRAIGEIIAALTLMLIASLTGVFLFTISLRSTSDQGKNLNMQIQMEEESSQERFRILNAVKDGNEIHTWILNYGVIDIQIVDAYINGGRTTLYLGGKVTISTSDLMKITLEIPAGIIGPDYNIVIVSERGVKHVSEWPL